MARPGCRARVPPTTAAIDIDEEDGSIPDLEAAVMEVDEAAAAELLQVPHCTSASIIAPLLHPCCTLAPTLHRCTITTLLPPLLPLCCIRTGFFRSNYMMFSVSMIDGMVGFLTTLAYRSVLHGDV